jgi:hypothetical protein
MVRVYGEKKRHTWQLEKILSSSSSESFLLAHGDDDRSDIVVEMPV